MFSQPFQCGAELPKGRRCEEWAKLTDAQYVHHQDVVEGRFEQILDEVQYTMECPRCGPWHRVVTVHVNRPAAKG